jgi:hypothetical protein
MGIKLKSFLVFFILLTCSCEHKKNTLPIKVIPVASTVGNYNILNLSDYATDIKYIPLETNDSALIGRISQISYENGKIFIKSISNNYISDCYLFDNNGNFCYKIGQYGQGPEDYNTLFETFIYDNFIYMMVVRPNKILIYNTNGLLVENIKVQINEITENHNEYFFHHIIPLKENIFVVNVESPYGHYPKAILLETNQSNSKTIKEYTNYVKLNKTKPSTGICEVGNMYRYKDEVRAYKALNDTIFTIDKNMEMKEAFVFDLGKYRPTISYIEQKEPDINFNNYIIPDKIFESSGFLFINFFTGNYTHEPFEQVSRHGWQSDNNITYGVFDKKTGKLALMKQPAKGKLGFKNDIDNGPVIWPHYISSNNELVTHISIEDFLDYYNKIENPTSQMTEIAKNAEMEDNQIIIVAKLK